MKSIRHTTKRITACIMILVLLTGMAVLGPSYAADPTVLQPPQRNRVSDIGYTQDLNHWEWYAKLNWEAESFPPEANEKYINLGLNEISYGTGKLVPDAFTVPLPGSATSYDISSYTPEGIKNGTIYESYVKATYKTNTPSGQYTVNSQKSNPAKFLTGLNVSVELIPGTNNIKIKWDDVWDTTGRISYRILISDTKGFTQPPPVPDIVASDIGKNGSPVTVNLTEKKLEYVYSYALPGREYSIKVVPLPASSVACATADEIEPITIKTDILLKAQKVGFTNEGDTIWKLFWNPIVKGNTYTRVDYELYRYTNSDPEGQLFRLIPDIDSYQITVKKNDPNVYSFKIDAKAYVMGSTAPIEFRSNNKVALKEQIPQQPQAPDIVDAFPNADPTALYYDNLLTSTSAAILWRVPYNGDGSIDTDITYDVYLVDDIKEVANPSSNYRIAADLSMGAANEIKDRMTGKVIGYRYDVLGLKSNATYYFVIYAKKNFLVQSPTDGFMITKPYASKQAVKVIITKPDTGTDRPIAPPAPPFGLKPGTGSVTFTEADLVLTKKWYALYDSSANRWESVSYEDYLANQMLNDSNPLKRKSTVVNYPSGWKVVPHVVSFNDALTAIKLRNNRTEAFIAYSDLSQADVKAFEIAQQPYSIPDIADDADQTMNFKLTGLTHNTAYIVWVTIQNQNGNSSDPSDPLILTTPPQIPDTPVTPTVPNDLKGIAADSFVDLFWTFTKDMDYEIKGGTSDTLTSASITA
ncbi:MAG: fibronectin type III domain-containing protein, partial [Clostridia bacterium]|nr:fibronectin type III domain-containing protein [Clostridia bacterium]